MLKMNRIVKIAFAGHLKEKLNFNIDDLCKLPADDLRWQVDYAISQVSYKTVAESSDVYVLLTSLTFSNEEQLKVSFKKISSVS